MKKILSQLFLIIPVLFVGIFFYGYITPEHFSKACAAKFGPQCGAGGNRACPANASFDPLTAYGTACVDSVNLSGKIRVRGLKDSAGSVKVAANVRGFERDNNYACNDVKCLKREDRSAPKTVTPGALGDGVSFNPSDSSYVVSYTIDTIGCSSDGNCNDHFSLTGVVVDQGRYNCVRADDQTLILKGLNGQSPPLPDVSINCTPPADVPTPTPRPPTPTTPPSVPTPTPRPPTPTPRPPTPTTPPRVPTPTPRPPTPTISYACPVPQIVPNVRIDCPTCQ